MLDAAAASSAVLCKGDKSFWSTRPLGLCPFTTLAQGASVAAWFMPETGLHALHAQAAYTMRQLNMQAFYRFAASDLKRVRRAQRMPHVHVHAAQCYGCGLQEVRRAAGVSATPVSPRQSPRCGGLMPPGMRVPRF